MPGWRPCNFALSRPASTWYSKGDSNQHLFFVDSGLLRLYYTTPDGKERNKSFYAEGAMRGCNTSKYGVPQLRRINPG